MLDLTNEIDTLMPQLLRAVERVLRSRQFILGEEVAQFEREAAKFLGTQHAIALNSGTDALIIALRSLGIGPGDEVITTSFTFFATAEAISLVGATPVFVDIEEDTFNINADRIRVSPRTKAILPVHLFGQPANMDAILSIGQKHGIPIIEDVAQAFGGEYSGKKLGTLGAMGCFSFYPTKNLGAYGDAGMVVTDNAELAEQARKLRTHGSIRSYHNELLGYNSRMDEIQAAILRIKLPFVDEWNRLRVAVANRYQQALKDVPGIHFPAARLSHVYHQYTVRINKRDEVQARMKEAGISTVVYYPVPVHRLPVYRDTNVSCPVAEVAASEVLSLPIWPNMAADAQARVINCLRQLLIA